MVLPRASPRGLIWIILLTPILSLILVAVFTRYVFASDLKTTDVLINNSNTGITLLDRSGQPFFTFYSAKNRDVIPLSLISKQAQLATVAAEDKDFYKHKGISPAAVMKSLIIDIRKNSDAYGGSTITQQLVKNSLLSSKKSVLRKFQEVILAENLEQKFNKDQILEMYLNSVYFGEGATGIENAAQAYFSKDAKDLNLAESAMLVGLLPAPSILDPFRGNPEDAKKRQQYVLDQMVDQHYITPSQAEKASKEKLIYKTPDDQFNTLAPHFALMVKSELIRAYGEQELSRSGFIIRTTLDPNKQIFAQKEVKKQVKSLSRNGVTNGAAVIINPQDGEILAMVGSIDWNNNKFGKVNMATVPRQPGSSFKPIIYAAALQKHIITPATILKDQPTTYPGLLPYSPTNYDHKFRGPVTVRRALSNSLNVPSVEVFNKLGISNALDFSAKLGITTLNDRSRFGLSLVLGSGEVPLTEMTNVYATFANGGEKHSITTILDIKDKNGNTVYSYTPISQRVIDPISTFLVSSILSESDTRAEIFGDSLNTTVKAAVKTGTTSDYKDSLTFGYTPNLAVGVWVGNNDNKPMDGIAGSLGAAPIWKNIIEKFGGSNIANFVPPIGVDTLYICKNNGLRLTSPDTSVGYLEYFASGTEPNGICNLSLTPTPIIQTPIKATSDQKKVDKKG